MRRETILVVWLGLATAAVVTACGGSGGTVAGGAVAPGATSPTTEPPPVTSTSTLPAATLPPTTVLPSTTTTSTTTTTTTTLPGVELAPGDEGDDVALLQTLLTEHGLFRDVVDGVFGPRTAQGVLAFHKATDAERTSTWLTSDWEHLIDFVPPELPERPKEPDRLELDLTRQLLFRIVEHELVDIIAISSGNGELYENASGKLVRARTPRGDFSLYKHYDGWRISYLGGLYRPWYFRGGYAIHGSNSVPAYPASHGCVRIPNWEADYLAEQLVIGLPVHVWD